MKTLYYIYPSGYKRNKGIGFYNIQIGKILELMDFDSYGQTLEDSHVEVFEVSEMIIDDNEIIVWLAYL
ncbi:MAG: hypothetical protein ACOYLO_00335 [Ferruginibacter sp.]